MADFVDEAVVELRSGKGGGGAATFHREKFMPRGGPNGADGGRGGDVTVVADRHLRTLQSFRFTRHLIAKNGEPARNNKTGKDGESIEIRVPVGTVVYDHETDEALADLSSDGLSFLACKGGKGGLGNLAFTNSVRQAPTFAQRGAPGEVLVARFELKLLADVGLVGLPNAGKSTLLSRVTAATPKIADYPFTTLVPNLGVVSHDGRSFVMADLPGLIEGASDGVGLGHRFLKHVERTKVLVHVVDAFPMDGGDPLDGYETIAAELANYSSSLADRPRLLVLNKWDAASESMREAALEAFHEMDLEPHPISAVTGEGIDGLLFKILEELERTEEHDVVPVVAPQIRVRGDDSWDVEGVEDGFRVVGQRIERMIAMTDLGSGEALAMLHRRLTRLGVIERLRQAGAEDGDTIVIGDLEFEFDEERM